MEILNQWAFIGVFAVMAPIFPALPILIAWILRPSKPNVLKSQTYECGVETVGDTWVQFRVQYYIYGLIFLVFDVEMVLMFPWAMAYNRLDLFGFVDGAIFILLLLCGLLYAWSKGVLDWK
jgi:NADH:ubiquinone oxidoreductase subunit 3 (subunit A)